MLSQIVQESVEKFESSNSSGFSPYNDSKLMVSGEAKRFLISSQISLLEEELERKEKTRRDENFYLRDAVSIVEEDISYLQDQITKCKELIK